MPFVIFPEEELKDAIKFLKRKSFIMINVLLLEFRPDNI